MKEKTISAIKELLNKIKDSGLSISDYCDSYSISKQSVYDRIEAFKKASNIDKDTYLEVMELYKSVKYMKSNEPKVEKENTVPVNEATFVASLFPEEEIETEEELETGERTQVSYTRDAEGHIIRYNYAIPRKEGGLLEGFLTREETTLIYQLYSSYGDNVSRKEISKRFPQFSIIDVRRLFRAFGIYKANSPFPPHTLEECSEGQLVSMQLRAKETSVLNKIAVAEAKNNERLLKKYVAENLNLQKQLDNITKTTFEVSNLPKINFIPVAEATNRYINLYIADMHIGAAMSSTPLYSENIRYGLDEINRRLTECISRIRSYGTFDHINICLMGDMMDCCGPTNKTARLDHDLPENMDGFEQANGYISSITGFVKNIAELGICKHINLYSVRSGNHTGAIEYVATKAIFAALESSFISTTIFDSFFGVFKEGKETFVITHGKDDRFMKKGLPANLDDKSRSMLYEWLDDNKLYGDNIHIVKGDLHTSNYNSCKRFDYRNVLSLFGSSDYSAYNFSRNSYGVSYDINIGGNIVRGDFQNM